MLDLLVHEGSHVAGAKAYACQVDRHGKVRQMGEGEGEGEGEGDGDGEDEDEDVGVRAGE